MLKQGLGHGVFMDTFMQQQKHKNLLVTVLFALLFLGGIVFKWLLNKPQNPLNEGNSNSFNSSTSAQGQSTQSESTGNSSPNPVVKILYLEITNIAQGVNIAIFVFIVTTGDFITSMAANYYSSLFLAMTSLLIVIVFWVRYYLDTEIIDRSLTVLSVTWFFLYTVVQGISISLILIPFAWFLFTSLFLFFGAGFYFLNLNEIRRKLEVGVMAECPTFMDWQKRRMYELIMLAALTLCGGLLLIRNPALVFLESIIAFVVALWQINRTRDYRKLGFIETGV